MIRCVGLVVHRLVTPVARACLFCHGELGFRVLQLRAGLLLDGCSLPLSGTGTRTGTGSAGSGSGSGSGTGTGSGSGTGTGSGTGSV
eukprot:SAG11_NODE_36486_length_261_cov_0.833333_1_plen_86_part_11